MTLAERWRSLPLFWKIYWTTVLLFGGIAASVEWTEDLVEPLLGSTFGIPSVWQEALLWLIGILGPSLLSGYLLSRFINRSFESIARTAARLAGGDLSARAEMTGNPDDAFGKMTGSFNAMAQSLERLLTNERRLLADISHELRSPLTRMHMAIALAQREDAPAIAPLIERMEKETARMTQMVALLLQQGRDNLLPDAPEEVDMADLIREIAADFRFEGQAEEKTAESFLTEPLPVRGNASQLRTMLASVAANALAYTPRASTVTMQGLRDNGDVIIIIRDQGPGVPPDAVEDIFRAFYRVDDSRARDTGGVGLGLAIARQVARSHGGDITARNADPGLAVVIRLPIFA